jgi:hypothetical protein
LNPVFLERLFPVLILLHLGATVFMLGAMTHQAFCVAGYLKGRYGRRALERQYGVWFLRAYAVVYLIGMLAYPAYKVHIDAAHFRPNVPWATGLFEVKEHWAVLGLAMVLGMVWLRRHFDPKKDREKMALYAPLCFLTNAVVWYVVIASCLVAMVKGWWV